jgi:hypothetical protein
MTGFLSQVTSGVTQAGQRIVIAAKEKMGKTTLACGAPGALLVPLEMGYAAMPVAKTPMLESWEQIEDFCNELIWTAQAGRIARGSSIVWDSATALERAIHDNVLRTDKQWRPGNPAKLTMESAHGGYGKAYQLANELFARWTRYQDQLAFHGGINIITTCHVFPSKVIDPAHGEYETWDLLLHSPKNEKTYGKREFMTQWADLIGFLHEPMFVMQAQEGQKMNRAVSANQGRVLGVDRTPGWVAGNRYGMTGIIPIPAPPVNGLPSPCWNALAHAIWNTRGIDVFNRSVG